MDLSDHTDKRSRGAAGGSKNLDENLFLFFGVIYSQLGTFSFGLLNGALGMEL